MESAEREEFEEMLKENGYRKEKIKEVLRTDGDDVVDLLYSATASSISIASARMKKFITGRRLFTSIRKKNSAGCLNKEPFADREREFYKLNERWEKMRSFVKSIEKEIEEYTKTIGEALLRVMTTDSKKLEDVQMLISSLKNGSKSMEYS